MLPSGHEIVKSLGGVWRGRQGMCRCPAHDDSSPSLHVTETRDTVLVRCFAGCDQRAVIMALRDFGLWPEREERGDPSLPQKKPIPLREAEPSDDDVKRMAAARALWDGSKPVWDTAAETYLRARGIRITLPPTLRFRPVCRHVTGECFPALIGALQNGQGRVVAVQRTYLRMDGQGKADVKPAKAGLGPMQDGAVRLGRIGRVLGIAEGIETALSAQQIYRLPVWACLGASRMHAVTIPHAVEHLVLFADAGEAGMAAAHKAADHYERLGLQVDIEAPAEGDWNDSLRAGAAA